MLTFEKLYSMGHEEVVFFSDPSCNLKAIIAIHNTTLGPALGGTRMWNYKSIDEAIEFLGEDELLEVTPLNFRIRKRILSTDERGKQVKKAEQWRSKEGTTDDQREEVVLYLVLPPIEAL